MSNTNTNEFAGLQAATMFEPSNYLDKSGNVQGSVKVMGVRYPIGLAGAVLIIQHPEAFRRAAAQAYARMKDPATKQDLLANKGKGKAKKSVDDELDAALGSIS